MALRNQKSNRKFPNVNINHCNFHLIRKMVFDAKKFDLKIRYFDRFCNDQSIICEIVRRVIKKLSSFRHLKKAVCEIREPLFYLSLHKTKSDKLKYCFVSYSMWNSRLIFRYFSTTFAYVSWKYFQWYSIDRWKEFLR